METVSPKFRVRPSNRAILAVSPDRGERHGAVPVSREERGPIGEREERIRPMGIGRHSGREHNVSHSARSCIFYDMASNLTSRARHNSRPCAGRAWPGPCHPPTFAMIGPSKTERVYVCVHRCEKTREHMKDSCARVHTHRRTGTQASDRIETIRDRVSS